MKKPCFAENIRKEKKEKHLKRRASARNRFSPHLFGRFFGLVSWTKN